MAEKELAGRGDRRVWRTWGGLLALTALMLGVTAAGLPRVPFIVVLLSAMLVKIGLIAGSFMHLRQEHAGLIWTFVVGLLLTGVLLYATIAPDALRIHDMARQQ